MTVTEEQVKQLAPDSRAFAASKKQATRDKWRRLGQHDGALWGVATGSKGDSYATFARGPDALGCTCPSRKRPCKHALGLLIMAARGERFAEDPLPDGHRFSSL